VHEHKKVADRNHWTEGGSQLSTILRTEPKQWEGSKRRGAAIRKYGGGKVDEKITARGKRGQENRDMVYLTGEDEIGSDLAVRESDLGRKERRGLQSGSGGEAERTRQYGRTSPKGRLGASAIGGRIGKKKNSGIKLPKSRPGNPGERRGTWRGGGGAFPLSPRDRLSRK